MHVSTDFFFLFFTVVDFHKSIKYRQFFWKNLSNGKKRKKSLGCEYCVRFTDLDLMRSLQPLSSTSPGRCILGLPRVKLQTCRAKKLQETSNLINQMHPNICSWKSQSSGFSFRVKIKENFQKKLRQTKKINFQPQWNSEGFWLGPNGTTEDGDRSGLFVSSLSL